METNGNRNDAKWDDFEKMMEDKVVFTVPIDESVKAGVVTSLKGVRAFFAERCQGIYSRLPAQHELR